jgi:hypothetical protein
MAGKTQCDSSWAQNTASEVEMFVNRPTAWLLLATAAVGCKWDEELPIEDLRGTVVVPAEAATRTVLDPDSGELVQITDVRNIGPVYLGYYASIVEGLESYPHPERGPAFEQDRPGDTYPYGGTMVGDIRFACLEFLTCKVTTGRYVDYDHLVDWFNNVIGTPITDASGVEVTNGDYVRQVCYDALHHTSDEEVGLTATDRNDDGTVDALDLDFVENSDGDFEAEFVAWQQDFYDGFSIWGWLDTPSEQSFQLSTCTFSDGYTRNEYNEYFYGGRAERDLLNYPSIYIASGDWVTPGHTYASIDDDVELIFNIPVED